MSPAAELDPRLFRRAWGRMVAALTRLFGVHNVSLAEDVAQDTLCRALEVWKFAGVPDDPTAWLMTTAKRRALDVLRREKTARAYAPELSRFLESEWTLGVTVDDAFAGTDDVLRMAFTCCHPRLPEEAQLALVLHVLSGFSVDEVAAALLSTPAATAKRIVRAKRVLAATPSLFDLREERDLAPRLEVVQRALYLLFNEGYHGASPVAAVRESLCEEAIYLTKLLAGHPVTASPSTHALLALLYLHAARLPARLDADGGLMSLYDQDRSRWDATRTAEGLRLLDVSATGDTLSEYHVEAAIAATHAAALRVEETRWGDIVALYDTLFALRPSPVVALSRALAVAQHEGPERGLAEVEAIADRGRIAGSPFYEAALAELSQRCGRFEEAEEHLEAAILRARNPMERSYLEGRRRASGERQEGSGGAAVGAPLRAGREK